jgi:hypothetical protein
MEFPDDNIHICIVTVDFVFMPPIRPAKGSFQEAGTAPRRDRSDQSLMRASKGTLLMPFAEGNRAVISLTFRYDGQGQTALHQGVLKFLASSIGGVDRYHETQCRRHVVIGAEDRGGDATGERVHQAG